MKTKLFARIAMASALVCAFTAHAADTVAIPKQTVDAALRAKLPKEILDAGQMTAVNNGSFPPYEIVTGTNTMTGATADLSDALGELLGIKINHTTVSGLSGILIGLKAGRYQVALGPVGDYPDRQAANDFIDWVAEYVVFGVQKGNPKGIKTIDDTCGLKVSVMAAGSAERVIKKQSEVCVAAGKPAIEVQSYTDQPTSILAVRSKRADAFFSSQAPLTYFIDQSNGELELAGIGQRNGFEDIHQGAVVAKNSPLGPVLQSALQKLYDNGTYAAIMKKWHLSNNMNKAPGMNLGGTAANK